MSEPLHAVLIGALVLGGFGCIFAGTFLTMVIIALIEREKYPK